RPWRWATTPRRAPVLRVSSERTPTPGSTVSWMSGTGGKSPRSVGGGPPDPRGLRAPRAPRPPDRAAECRSGALAGSLRKSSLRSLSPVGAGADHGRMMLHPDIARWMVAADHERLAGLARPRRPRPGAARPARRRDRTGGD